MPLVELHIDLVDRPSADEAVGGVVVAGGEDNSEACKEKEAFFHALEFEAKVMLFVIIDSSETNVFHFKLAAHVIPTEACAEGWNLCAAV